jgi:hypothetical protein
MEVLLWHVTTRAVQYEFEALVLSMLFLV